MQVGIINDENFPQILRGISQRRRNGILELHVGERNIEVSFCQGKIVDVSRDKQNILKQIAERLVARDSILAGEWLTTELSVAALLEQSESSGFDLTEETLMKIWEQQALENLYSIDVHSGSYYNFRVEFVPSPAPEAVQISVGQLLLDLVGYQDGHQAFILQCSEDQVLRRGIPADREYTFEEQDLIWLVDGELTIAQLRERSMLNRLTFEETMLSLLSEQVLAKHDTESDARVDLSEYDLDSALDSCIGQARRTTPGLDSAESLVREIWAEKKIVAAESESTPPKKSFDLMQVFERASDRILSSAHAPDVIYFVYLLFALTVPYFFW